VSARSKARKRALDLLYSAELRDVPVQQVLEVEAERAAGEPERQASWLYAREIVDGYLDHRDTIDELISYHAHDWALERMPAVDRALLRIGTWEMCTTNGCPTPWPSPRPWNLRQLSQPRTPLGLSTVCSRRSRTRLSERDTAG